jgi:hypothetical protein
MMRRHPRRKKEEEPGKKSSFFEDFRKENQGRRQRKLRSKKTKGRRTKFETARAFLDQFAAHIHV